MHNYEHRTGSNLWSLINYFEHYGYRSDGNDDQEAFPTSVVFMGNTYKDSSSAIDAAEERSYWNGTSIAIARIIPNKTTKAFDNAWTAFIEKRKDYKSFERNLTISYGRKSSKVTCPRCKSMINIQYGRFFKECPVCGSKEIISDSNWKTLTTKKNTMVKGAEILEREANKCGITFVAAIGWHS